MGAWWCGRVCMPLLCCFCFSISFLFICWPLRLMWQHFIAWLLTVLLWIFFFFFFFSLLHSCIYYFILRMLTFLLAFSLLFIYFHFDTRACIKNYNKRIIAPPFCPSQYLPKRNAKKTELKRYKRKQLVKLANCELWVIVVVVKCHCSHSLDTERSLGEHTKSNVLLLSLNIQRRPLDHWPGE